MVKREVDINYDTNFFLSLNTNDAATGEPMAGDVGKFEKKV